MDEWKPQQSNNPAIQQSGNLMNLPNKLTVSRFALTALFIWALFSPVRFNDTLALVFFCVASFTDYLDGSISRRRGLVTNFGILMDPLADKILVCSAFIAFVESTQLNPDSPVKVAAWMVVIIVAREMTITGLRLLAVSKKVVLGADNLGKYKTIAQMSAIIALLIADASNEWWPWLKNFFHSWVGTFAEIALWLAVALTVASGLAYLWRNRAIYLSDM